MIVYVSYVVPVIAIVDTRSGEVDRVVVDDECVRFDDEFLHEDQTPVKSARAKRRAFEIAETQIWPVWETGF